MEAEDKTLTAVRGKAPLFTEEAKQEARPVVPLGRAADAAPPAREAPRRRPAWNLATIPALVAGVALGMAAGYLTYVKEAAETPAAATAPAPVSPEPPPSSTSEASTATDTEERAERPARVEPPQRDESERPDRKESGRRGRDERGRDERGRGRDEKDREREKKMAERMRVEAEKVAERMREQEKDGKPKARLFGVMSEKPRP